MDFIVLAIKWHVAVDVKFLTVILQQGPDLILYTP